MRNGYSHDIKSIRKFKGAQEQRNRALLKTRKRKTGWSWLQREETIKFPVVWEKLKIREARCCRAAGKEQLFWIKPFFYAEHKIGKTINTLVPTIHPWLVPPCLGRETGCKLWHKGGCTGTPQNEPRAAVKKIVKKAWNVQHGAVIEKLTIAVREKL